MSKAEAPVIRAHEDAALFRDAVQFTAARSGFTARLVEKDYFCTLLLAFLNRSAGNELVFKGGTCLTKVYAQLYRFSEDLDFTISVPLDATRKERSVRVESIKTALNEMKRTIPALQLIETLKGANRSTQYLAVVGYGSTISQQQETIKVEVSLREPLLLTPRQGVAQTILQNPLTNHAMVAPIAVRSIDANEAWAEKFRAALSRREPAIRDFYDVDYAVRRCGLMPENKKFITLVNSRSHFAGGD